MGEDHNENQVNNGEEKCKDCAIQTEEVLFHMCEMCESKFLSEDKLRSHRHEEHRDENNFTCRSCPKHYSRLNHLQRHIAYSHPEISNIRFLKDNLCNICNKSFTRPDHLRRHIENVHREMVHFINLDQIGEEQSEYDVDMKFVDDDDMKNELISKHDNIPIESDEIKFPKIKTEKLDSSGFINNSKEMGILPGVEMQSSENTLTGKIENYSYEDQNDNHFYDDEENDNNDQSHDENFTTKVKTESTSPATVSPKAAKQVRQRFKEEYSCNECDIKFTVRPKYAKHMEEVHNVSKIFKCKTCEKTFGRATHLRRHELTHLDIKPYKCDQCEKRFSRLDHLNLHKHHHSDVKPYTCEICGKGFARGEHLRKHLESRHSDKDPPPKSVFCEVCKKGFSTQKYLQIHMRIHTQKSWSCKFCQEEFESKKDMHDHQRTHNNERPFLCSECGLRFVRNDYLVIHMRRHKGEKPYKCKFCGKGFPRATDLTVHERYHTGEKTHLCTICGKGFQRAYNLLVHMRVHTGERPYECPHCNKKFAQGNDLKAHVRRHTGERYKCDICGDGFIQGYHLTQHKRNVHGIDMQSHIRRVEKFTTPIAQQMRVLEQQQQQQHDQNNIQEHQVVFETGAGQSSFVPMTTEIDNKAHIIKMEPQITILDTQYAEQTVVSTK